MVLMLGGLVTLRCGLQRHAKSHLMLAMNSPSKWSVEFFQVKSRLFSLFHRHHTLECQIQLDVSVYYSCFPSSYFNFLVFQTLGRSLNLSSFTWEAMKLIQVSAWTSLYITLSEWYLDWYQISWKNYCHDVK